MTRFLPCTPAAFRWQVDMTALRDAERLEGLRRAMERSALRRECDLECPCATCRWLRAKGLPAPWPCPCADCAGMRCWQMTPGRRTPLHVLQLAASSRYVNGQRS